MSESLDSIIYLLYQKQRRKTVGLLNTDDVRVFGNALHNLLILLQSFGDGNYLHKAELTPKTTERQYESYNWNTPVAYRGPFTLVKFEDNEFRIIRIESESDYYMTSLRPMPGVTIQLNIPCSFMSMKSILRLIPRGVDTESCSISAHENELNIVIYCSIDAFSYSG